MIRVVWWTCALLAAAHARIYDRCELARELQNLGVWHEHVSTWVCIAYHESRFDTAANNPHSGDHGIFQISELYWCGGGKACGLSCAALRDDNIADDLQCARKVHEEHTRLQGDGFQAWVVYPQHCKGNTKKYLADCDLRNGLARTMGDSNSIAAYDAFKSKDSAYKNNPIIPAIDNLLPPYLMISSIFRDRYAKMLDNNKINNVDWFNYKYDKVDELKLPVLRTKADDVKEPLKFLMKAVVPNPVSTTTVKTTTTTTYIPPVVPWKFIESNQFRKKVTPGDTITKKPTTKQDFTLQFQIYTERPAYNASATKLTTKQDKIAYEKHTVTPSYSPAATELTTRKSITTVTQDISPKVKSTTTSYKSYTAFSKPVNMTNTAYKLPFTTSYRSTISPPVLTTSSYKFTSPSWWHKTTTPKALVSTTAPILRVTNAPTSVKPSTTLAPVKSSLKFTPRYTFSKLPTTMMPTTLSVTQRPTFVASYTTKPSQETSRSTQSIWDLYLNPTKPPKYESFNLSRSNSKYKLNIFSDGTTTAAP